MRGPAPAVGSGEPVWSAASARLPRTSPGAPTRYPLEGLKVLDFGNFLAGPLGPMLLADLGATVVKVEATTGDPMRWADWPFAGCQRGKRAVALDVKSPASRPALEALLRWADVVHHNLRMPAARRLGLDAAAVRAVNPDVVFCHVSSYGPQGPRADWPGYDQLFQASCGWEVMGAGEGNPPMWHRFGFMDHLCAMSSVAGTLMALLQRDRTGRATDVAASLLGAGVLTNSETYRRPDGTLAPVPVLDHDQTMVGPGERILQLTDGWIAVSAVGDEQVSALCRVRRCRDARRPALRRRRAGRPASCWRRSATAGVPAAAVRQGQQGAVLRRSGPPRSGTGGELHARRVGSPRAARCDVVRSATRRCKLDRAPPVLGEHTVEVLREVGVPQAEIDELLAAGAAVQR